MNAGTVLATIIITLMTAVIPFGSTDEIGVSQSDNCITSFYNVSNFVYEKCLNKANATYYDCNPKEKITVANSTKCTKAGYDVKYRDETFRVRGDCCMYYEKSPYKEFIGQSVISCKPIILGICNPLIQQSSEDYSVYDEEGKIFVIQKEGIKTETVGYTDYQLKTKLASVE